MSDNRGLSGFFTRKSKHNSFGSARTTADAAVPNETPADTVDSSAVPSITFDEPARTSDGVDAKSFFRLPRRKKASSLSRGDDQEARRSSDRTTSMEQARPSSTFVRSPFESLFRPSMSPRSSTVSIAAAPSATSTAMISAGTSLAAQGSPKFEIKNPLERRSGSRQPSVKSVHSLRSLHSATVSDRTPTIRTLESAKQIKNRGRSLTYSGTETKSKSGNSGKSSKFFSMSRLLRDPDDSPLFRVLSKERSPQPMPGSPQRLYEIEIPKALPPAMDGETPFQFLARMEAKLPRKFIASLLAITDDSLHHECLQLYMQQFQFAEDPLDVALRKLLMDTHLPKETQQIDRVLNAFSHRYQICNPRLYDTQATPYVLSFALIMLHTDRFNQNNKNKMTKAQFIKNTTSEHTSRVSPDVLEYFYDNIISTPFILVEDDVDGVSSERSNPTTPNEFMPQAGSRAGSISTASQNNGYFGKRSMDIYPLIMENKLDNLRPHLGPILDMENSLSYAGTHPVLNIAKLHNVFTHPATLQLVSARSRPEAFVTDDSTMNPLDTDPGLVDIQIIKIGILRKREQKKAGSKPVYREWGVMLTQSQLLLFKNVAWVKSYMQQSKEKSAEKGIILTPPVHNYSPDTYLPTSDTVAIFDQSASKKSTHFCFYGRGGQQTHLIASSEEEMNDWIAKINYAASFHSIGVRIRGTETVGDGHNITIRRMNRHASTSSISTLGGSQASAQEIALARCNVLRTKIHEMSKQLQEKEEKLALLQQYARNLCTLTPVQPRTRAQVISAAGSLSAKISWARMELCKTQCHHDILAKDLELETSPDATSFTAPVRPRTPSSEHNSTLRTSPSKVKLGSVFRQVSTDTMKRVNRQFSHNDIKKAKATPSTRYSMQSIQNNGHERNDSEYSIPTVDLSPESLSHLFSNSPDRKVTTSSLFARQAEDMVPRGKSPALSDHERPRKAPNLRLNISLLSKQSPAQSKKGPDHDTNSESAVKSPSSSSQGSGHFMLHGRKVSVVQTPTNLIDENSGRSSLFTETGSNQPVQSEMQQQVSEQTTTTTTTTTSPTARDTPQTPAATQISPSSS